MVRIFLFSILACITVRSFAADHSTSLVETLATEPTTVNQCSPAAILSEMYSYYPVPISVSPDGKRILERDRPTALQPTILRVIEVRTRRILGRLEWKESVVHLSWRQEGWSISFFSQDATTNLRRLFVWNLKDGKVRLIPTPQTSNEPLVRWSPDGSKLAFAQGFQAIVIVSADGSGAPVTYAGQYSMFAWSANSQQLALVPDDLSHEVIVADATFHHFDRRIISHSPGKILDVAWQPRTNFLILLETKEGVRSLNKSDETGANEEVLFSAKADLRSPVWLPPGQGFLFNQNAAGEEELFLGSEHAGIKPRPLVNHATATFLGLLPGGSAIVVTYRSRTSIQVRKLFLDGKSSESLASARVSALGTIEPQKVNLISSDGMRSSILLWRVPKSNDESLSVVIRVHSDLESAESPSWQEDVQTYLKHGVDFIGVNYRESARFGIDFNNSGDMLGRSRDVVAACKYAHDSLRIPFDRIVVLGHSNGAAIAMGAALLAPHSMGTLVLISLPGMPRDWMKFRAKETARPDVIFGIHGEKDALLSPLRARALIEGVFGTGAFAPNYEHWFVIPGETHTLQQDQSWAFVHATILHSLSRCGH